MVFVNGCWQNCNNFGGCGPVNGCCNGCGGWNQGCWNNCSTCGNGCFDGDGACGGFTCGPSCCSNGAWGGQFPGCGCSPFGGWNSCGSCGCGCGNWNAFGCLQLILRMIC